MQLVTFFDYSSSIKAHQFLGVEYSLVVCLVLWLILTDWNFILIIIDSTVQMLENFSLRYDYFNQLKEISFKKR